MAHLANFIKILLYFNYALAVSANLGSLPFGIGLDQVQFQVNAGLGHRDIQSAADTEFYGIAIDKGFSKYVEKLMDIWNVTGLSLVVVKPDGDIEYGNWGNSTEDGHPVTSDLDTFLATSMGILIDEYAAGQNTTPLASNVEKFDWKTKVIDLIPDDWELKDEWASKKANVRDILSHMSGLPRHDGSYGPYYTAEEGTRKLRFLEPLAELRETWQYNNQMYTAGAHVISSYTGSYIDYAADHIFKPLGMNSTTFSPRRATASGKLSQSWTAHRQRIPYWLAEESIDFIAGAGGIISNTIDLSKWLKLLLNSGINPENNQTLISQSSFDAITSPHGVVVGQPKVPEMSIAGYGMGWLRYSYQGHEVITHNGAIPGFSSFIAFLPNDKIAFASLINMADRAQVNEAVSRGLIEKMLSLPKGPTIAEPAPLIRPNRPANASPPIPIKSYGGVYSSPGYGSFSLCSQEDTSFYCEKVKAEFQIVDKANSLPVAPDGDVPQLFAEWPRLWSSHLRLIHWKNNIFNVSMTALFPEGYGESKVPFEHFEMDLYAGYVEFHVMDGKVIGFGLTYMIEPRAAPSKPRGDAWFRKV